MKSARSMTIPVLCVLGSVVGGVLGGAVFSPGTTAAQGDDAGAPKLVKAQEFLLVDKNGNEKARLATKDDGIVQFELLDSAARTRLRLQCEEKGASIGIVGKDGNENVYLASFDDEQSDATVLAINGVNDKPVFSVQHRGEQSEERSKLEETYLGVYDRQANPRLLLGWNGDEVAQFTYFDAKGEPAIRLAAVGDTSALELSSSPKGASLLALRSGKAHFVAGASEQRGTSLQHWHDSKLRLGAQTMEDGRPILKMLDSKGNVTWEQTEKQD